MSPEPRGVTGRRDWSPLVVQVAELLEGSMPADAKLFRTQKARERFLASPETDHWGDDDVLLYKLLSDVAIAYEDCQ